MDLYSDLDMQNNSIVNCSNFPTGNSGGVDYLKVYQTAQSNLFSGGLRTVELAPVLTYDTIGASINNNVITLPSGVYTLDLTIVGQLSKSNAESKTGYILGGSVQSVYNTQYMFKKNYMYTLTLTDMFSIPVTTDIKFYVQRTSGSGTFYTSHNAGRAQLLRVGGN